MDIKNPIENEYMKCVLKINRFSGQRPQVQSSLRVGSSQGGAIELEQYLRAFVQDHPKIKFFFFFVGLNSITIVVFTAV